MASSEDELTVEDTTELLLKSSLLINGRKCDVILNKSYLHWEEVTSFRSLGSPQLDRPAEPLYNIESNISNEKQTIFLKDIIAVKYVSTLPRGNKLDYTELTNLKPSIFCIHCVQRLKKHKWRSKTVTFDCGDATYCQKWVNILQTQLDEAEFKHPKHLLVFVNPFGGKRKGPKIYTDKVAPLFHLAGIQTDVFVTDHAGQASEILQEYDLSSIDGIVSVGGDGMFAEVFNGLLRRSMKDHQGSDVIHYTDDVIPSDMHIGIIPAGSTDTVAYTSMGIADPITSALHIIIGNSLPIDACAVYGKDKNLIRFAVSMIAYGFYGDVLKDSEQHRWMGPKRYNWSGFKKVLSNRCYEGTVSFVRSETSDDYNPQDSSRCYSGCDVCALDSDTASRSSSLYEMSDWEHHSGLFIGINTFTIPCKTGMSPEGVAPSCHLGDGCTDLVMVKKTGRLKYVKHMMRIANNTANQFDFDFVEAVRVKAFRYHGCSKGPMSSHKVCSEGLRQSVWNCDGEIIEEPQISVRVHRQIIKLFATGVQNPSHEVEDCTSCVGCTKLR